MKQSNTRRGCTQQHTDKNCHSKFNLESHHCLRHKVISRIKYGMTALFNTPLPGFAVLSPQGGQKPTCGFTLIELLVVVLIIGILAAVALPQYNKAVEKTRVTEALILISALEKAVDARILEHGYEEWVWKDSNDLDIDVQSLLDCTKYSNHCASKDFAFSVECYASNCIIYAERIDHSYNWLPQDGVTYALSSSKNSAVNQWTHHCSTQTGEMPLASYICAALQGEGWTH